LEKLFVNTGTGGLQIDNATITNTYCGDAAGAIDITVSGGTGSYDFSWSNGRLLKIFQSYGRKFIVTVTDD